MIYPCTYYSRDVSSLNGRQGGVNASNVGIIVHREASRCESRSVHVVARCFTAIQETDGDALPGRRGKKLV